MTVRGPLDARGFVADFFDLDKIVNPLVFMLDHRLINEVSGLDNPTAEIIARWFCDRIPFNASVRVYETPDASAEYAP